MAFISFAISSAVGIGPRTSSALPSAFSRSPTLASSLSGVARDAPTYSAAPSISLVSSNGSTNFVEAPAPSCFSVSRLIMVSAFESIAAAPIEMMRSPCASPCCSRIRAVRCPCASRICACRRPSASRMRDCLSPSAFRIAARFSPSARRMLARRLRSAAVWSSIACLTLGDGSTSRISTFSTLTPHLSVSTSRRSRRPWLIRSRFEST